VPLRRNGYLQAYRSANVEPLQRLRIIRLDPRNQLSFGVATGNPDGECLHSLRAGCAAHISNRTPRPGYISHSCGIRSKCLRHGASAGEHQRAVVRLQIVFAYAEVLLQEGFVDRPILLEYWFDVGTVPERAL